MGFFDKVKQEAMKIVDDTKKIVEGAKEVRNTPEIKDVTSWGSIYGDNFPKSPRGEEVRYDFDVSYETSKLIVFYTVHGTFKSTYKLIAEYSIDDIVEFKIEKAEKKEYGDYVTDSYRHHIILSSGEILRTYHSITERTEGESVFSLERNYKDTLHLGFVYYAFALIISDEKTKQIANEFYVNNGSNALFDENGKGDFDKASDAFELFMAKIKMNYDEKT